MSSEKKSSKTSRVTLVPDKVTRLSGIQDTNEESGAASFASRKDTKRTVGAQKQFSRDRKMPPTTESKRATTLGSQFIVDGEGRRCDVSNAAKQSNSQKESFAVKHKRRHPSGPLFQNEDMVGRRGIISGAGSSKLNYASHRTRNDPFMQEAKTTSLMGNAHVQVENSVSTRGDTELVAENVARLPTSAIGKSASQENVETAGYTVGAVAVAGIDAHDDDDDEEEDSMFAETEDDTRTVETRASTVVAKAVTDEELREQLRDELRGEFQEEMEANIVHGEVMDAETGNQDDGPPKFWTKRRLWIAGGVILLAMAGIVVGLVIAVTGTKSDPADSIPDFTPNSPGALDPTSGNISEMCIEDTEALYQNNPALEEAFFAYSAEQESQELSDSCTVSGNTATCTVNPTTLSTFPAFRDACTAAGGKGWTISDSVSCSGVLDGQSITFTFILEDVFICVAQSCSQEEIDADFDSSFQELEAQLETALGISCGSSNPVPPGQ